MLAFVQRIGRDASNVEMEVRFLQARPVSEGWPSGLRRPPAKREFGKNRTPGFESPTFRQSYSQSIGCLGATACALPDCKSQRSLRVNIPGSTPGTPTNSICLSGVSGLRACLKSRRMPFDSAGRHQVQWWSWCSGSALLAVNQQVPDRNRSITPVLHARSSMDQSVGLRSRRLQVRPLPGMPEIQSHPNPRNAPERGATR